MIEEPAGAELSRWKAKGQEGDSAWIAPRSHGAVAKAPRPSWALTMQASSLACCSGGLFLPPKHMHPVVAGCPRSHLLKVWTEFGRG